MQRRRFSRLPRKFHLLSELAILNQKSQTFPTTGYGIAHNLKPELQEQIQEAFFTFDWKGSELEEEFSKSGEAQFIPITFKEHWEVIRKIDDANGVEYNCR